MLRSEPSIRSILLAFGLACLSFGQLNRGTITGLLTDPSHAVIPNATVTAIHVATNVASKATSTETGNYTLPSLPIGLYRIEVEAAGFKRAVRDNAVVNAGSTVRLDATLEIGSTSESIEVQAKSILYLHVRQFRAGAKSREHSPPDAGRSQGELLGAWKLTPANGAQGNTG